MKKWIISFVLVIALIIGIYSVLLSNPRMFYDHTFTIDQVTVYHNNPLPGDAIPIIKNAIDQAKSHPHYSADVKIKLCLNDGSVFPNIHPLAGGVAYSFLRTTVEFDGNIDWTTNRSIYSGRKNPNVVLTWNLTDLIAHEFTHNMQWNNRILDIYTQPFWKIEGEAEYHSRGYSNSTFDQQLTTYDTYLKSSKEGEDVIYLEDETVGPIWYYRFGLYYTYLKDVQGLSKNEIYALDVSENEMESTILSLLK